MNPNGNGGGGVEIQPTTTSTSTSITSILGQQQHSHWVTNREWGNEQWWWSHWAGHIVITYIE